jgi:predicted DCC family thiol-disulfide oxidoreductase YuxK
MVKVFGISNCEGCTQLIALLISKGVKYEYYDVKTPQGLGLLASYGLADQQEIPIVVNADGKMIDVDNFVNEVV